ncbi:MAG: tetratricopeptide repeat protein, partial [Bacteroidales bacterium]|nr:tetratricopeptide repeat protein [Bacteroidales bacterium]
MHKRIFAASMAAIILTGYAAMYAGPVSREYRQALNLYQRGMYEQARSMFESIIAESDDVMAEGYAVLCAVKMQSDGYQTLVDDYDFKYPESSLRSQIHYLNALNLFDAENYEAAAAEFSRVNPKAIYKEQTPEFIFKQSYSDFGIGNYDSAVSGFTKVESMPFSDYTAPSRYALGYIDYIRENFDGAFKWFSQSVKDHRFAEMSSYYMLECRFMNKDYRYVIENGVTMYDKVPEDRKPHLARIISEAYLVLGDPGKAREYYETTVLKKPNMNRSDYFYAGSVLYSVEDWQGAIDNFSKMSNRTDSLGQKANYNLGFSYIQTKNKVAAMGAFKAAADYSYDKDIQEDAYFNYAKLAFDLNHDGSAFSDYIAKYADSKRGDGIYNYMALACLYNHDYAGAVEAYDNIDELDESMRANYMKANYLRANQLVENGSYRDAISCLRAASFFTDKHDTFNQLSRFWLAESYFRSGKYLESRSIFSELYNLSALDGHMEGNLIPYNIGYCYFMEEDYKSASDWFGRYLDGNSSEYGREAAIRKADCDFVQKKYSAAVEGYNMVISKYDNLDDLYPYYQCGLAYGLDGKKQKKVEILEKAKTAPVSAAFYPETMYELGRAYVAVDNYDDAIRCFKNLRGDSMDQEYAAKSLIELGMIYNNKGDYNQALTHYKDVVAKMPGTEYAQDALQAIESIYQIKGEADQYLAYAESIGATTDKTDAEKEELYFVAAERVFLSGNYQKALTSLDTYRSKYPNGVK